MRHELQAFCLRFAAIAVPAPDAEEPKRPGRELQLELVASFEIVRQSYVEGVAVRVVFVLEPAGER